MEQNVYYFLALFTLLAISSIVHLLSKKIRLPYTVLLVACGILLVPISHWAPVSFIKDFTLTPPLLFYIFLPILIFESAYNMHIRNIVENIRSISLLSIVSLLISAGTIATGLYVVFGFFGFPIPFIVALLFASIISATDPVAVLSLFKEYGAPKRLTLIFEGESLFNDGTAVALFLVVLSIAQNGFHGSASVIEGVFLFLMMVCGGILFGIGMGALFTKLIEKIRYSEFTAISVTLVSAHLTYILSEIISNTVSISGHHITISPIIATMTMALFIGSYGKTKLPIHAEEFIEKFWAQCAFIANSLVFLLMGLLFANLPISLHSFLFPVIGAVVIVAIARALSVYPVISLLNITKTEAHIPLSWQHLLSWGSLRGALAVMVVLLIPATYIPVGWQYSFTPQEFILALTIGCILATLTFKATTIGALIKKLGVDTLTPTEEKQYGESLAIIRNALLSKIDVYAEKGYIKKDIAESLSLYEEKQLEKHSEHNTGDEKVFAYRVLRMYAIGVELHTLKDIFANEEISEPVYIRLKDKLTLQLESLEAGTIPTNTSCDSDTKNVFETIVHSIDSLTRKKHSLISPTDKYLYYRAQAILARKVIKHLKELSKSTGTRGHVFHPESFTGAIAVYEDFLNGSGIKFTHVCEEYPLLAQKLSYELAERALAKVEDEAMNELVNKGLIGSNIRIALTDTLTKERSDRYITQEKI